MKRGLKRIQEFRGVSELVAARILCDDNTEDGGYQTGEVFDVAGIAEISKTTSTSSAVKYYDNTPALVVESTGADEITCTVSVLPLDILAELTGQFYDETLGMLVEGERETRYFALGYRTKKIGDGGGEVFVWRNKGTFRMPDESSKTEDDSTDSNGQELVFTGISTTHKSEKTGKPFKATIIDLKAGNADASNFFNQAQTPDTVKEKPLIVSAVTVHPPEIKVRQGERKQFTATVTEESLKEIDQSVNWTVNGGTQETTIEETGLLRVAEGETATVLTITASSVIDASKTGTARVEIEQLPIITDISVIPETALIKKGESKQFTSRVDGKGEITKEVEWDVLGAGEGTIITEEGILTIGRLETASSLTVQAKSKQDITKTATAIITVIESDIITNVTVIPDTATMKKGESKSFSATITGTGDYSQEVEWSISGGIAETTINQEGELNIATDETDQQLTITAVSAQDRTKKGTAIVTITE